jgi:hypothetical protein
LGSGGKAHNLDLGTSGFECSASRPGRFTSREGAPCTHWIGGWVGPRAGLDAVVKRKILSPSRDSNPRSSSSQPSAIHNIKIAPKEVSRANSQQTESKHFPCSPCYYYLKEQSSRISYDERRSHLTSLHRRHTGILDDSDIRKSICLLTDRYTRLVGFRTRNFFGTLWMRQNESYTLNFRESHKLHVFKAGCSG